MKHIVHIKDVPPNCHAAAVLLDRAYKQMERKAWNKARKSFLEEELKKKGSLKCFYCHHPNLNISGGKLKDKATVDHVIAKSEGGNALCHSNFVVSCEGCNRKKASQTQQEFLNSRYLAVKLKSKS